MKMAIPPAEAPGNTRSEHASQSRNLYCGLLAALVARLYQCDVKVADCMMLLANESMKPCGFVNI